MATYPLSQLFGSSKSSKHAWTTAYATMPPHQDRYEVRLELVTIAGTEHAMQADLSHCEDVAELEDDILCFLPTVSDLDVFGCELDLLDLHTQQPLPEAFHTVLLQRPQLQIVAWSTDIPSSSSRKTERKATSKLYASRPTRVGKLLTESFMLHPRIQHAGFAAWQSCQQLQIVKLPPSVISLEEGTFQGCYVLREVAAPGCVQYSRRVFEECCSLGRVGVSHETEDSNVLAPGPQQVASRLQPSPLTWTILTNLERCLKVHFVAQALNSSVCRVSGRGPVKIAKDLWRSTSWAQKSQLFSLPHLPTV